MFELIQKGGPLMYLIILCSIFSMAIFLERFIHLYKAEIDTEKFIENVKEAMKKKKLKGVVDLCNNTPGPISAILKAAVMKYDRTREEIREAVEEAGYHEIKKLEKNLNILDAIVNVAPLLGLLGTVTGMISTFRVIQEKSASGIAVNPGDLAGGVWEALLTTAAGLVVAIPTYVAYNYLLNRVNMLVTEMEESSTELINILISGRNTDEV